MNKQHIVTEQLRDLATELAIGIAHLQKPSQSLLNCKGTGRNAIRIIYSEKETVGNNKGQPLAAIVIYNSNLEVTALERLSSRYTAVAVIRRKGGRPVAFISAYFKPATGLAPLLAELRHVMGLLTMETIIGVDTNAHSQAWHHVSTTWSAMAKGR